MAEVAVDHGRIARGWMMSFNGMVQKGMMEFGRGGHTGTAPTIPLEQTSKNKLERLLSLSKRQKNNLRLARSWANAKKIIWNLPEAGQTLKK